MAEKKSWRDYSKNYTEDESADNSTSSKKTGSWRDYSKSFSSDNRNTSNTSAIDWRNYAEKDTASIVGENLTNRVNTWLENHNNYITNYQTRNSGRKFNYEDSYVSDSADWLNTISQQKSAFDTEADSILAQLDQYKGYFNDEWVESVRKTLTDARSAQDIILANSTKDNEWWNSFGNAELVNAFGSAEDAYKYYQRSDGYRQKYAGQKYDDIQKALSTLEDGEEKDWLTNNQYEFYKDDTTYNSKSRSGWKSFEAQKIAEWKEEESKTWFDKALDSFATTPADTSLPNAGLINAQVAYTNDTTYREPNEKWSADQRNQFGYLWATDRDKAYEYAVQVNSQIADYEEYLAQQGAQQDATKNGWTMTGHTIGAIASAPLALGDLLGDLVEYSARGTITSDGMLSPFEYSQAVQSGIANKLNKVDENGVAQSVLPDWVPIVGGKGWGDVYSLGVSAANSLVSAYTMGGAGTLINFIGQGGASGVDEALSRGASPGQALLYGAIVGAAEGATEMLSADKLIKVGSASTLKNYLLKALGQGVGEFAEEGVSSVIGNIADNIIMQDKSNFYDTVEQIMDKNPGMSEEEAKTKAWLDMVGDIAFDALGGFVTGATNAMTVGGVNTAVDAWKGNQQNIDAIKQYGEHTDALIQEGLQSDKNSESYQLAEKYQKKTEGGKALSGFQIRNLVKANDAQFVVEDYNEALPKAKERLKALGETKNVDKIADLVAKRVSRQELTRSEKSTLARSQFGAQVAKEMTTPTVETQNGTKIYNATYKSLEDRVGTEGRFGVSESGQATIRETNEAIDIGTLDVATVGDGQMTFKVAEDREVYAGDIDFADEDQSFLVSAVSDIENITPAAATAIMHDVVDTSKPLGAQLNGIDEAYTYGYNGYSVEDMKTGDFTSNLTDVQMMSAYRLGQSARSISDTDADAPIVKMRTAADAKLTAEQKTAKQKARIESMNVEVYFETGGTVTKFDEHTGKYDDKRMAAVNTAKFLSKLGIGGKYYFFESYENADGVRVYKDANGNEVEAPNGMYKDADGSIHIDLNAGNEGQGTALFTLGHELTHFVKAQSKKQFKILGDLVTEAFDKTDTSMHDRVVAKQEFLSKIRGHHVTYTEAFEEVVADAMSTMITDGSFHEKIMEIKVKDKGLFNTIKRFFEKMIAKFREVYAELTPDQRDARDIREMKDMFDKIQTAFAEALVEASDNFHAAMESVVEAKAEPMSADEIVTEGAVVTDGEGVRHSIRSMKHDIAEGKMFEDLKTVCGWTQAQVDTLKTQLKDLVEYMIPYRNILDMNETYGAEGRRFSPYKPNSDPLYKISMDFSTLCSKRLLTQYVIEQLQLRENRPMSAEEQMAIRDMLNEYRKVEKGLQVACAMCYVEAARLKSPKQVQRWLDDPAPLLKDYFGKKNKAFNDSVKKAQADFKESKGYDREAPKKDMKPADVNELNKIGPKMRSQYQLSAEEQAIVERAKSLPNSTYLTAANLANLSETDPVIYDAYTAFVRTATRSKSLEKDEPYYYGDSTRDNGNGIVVTDSFIEAVNKENGMRFSSWSDWRIQHLLDYITAVIDNSVRGAAMHGYTKFGDEIRVLGKTGMMFNMSGVAGTQTGLNEDGSLSFSPTESIDVNEAIQLREEFPEHAGLQCIGVSDEHIVALLRSDIIDYVIPYHVSGLNAVLRRMVNIYGWADYTGTQHASIDKSVKLENAVDKEHWHEEPVFSEFFVGYDTGMTGIDAMRASAEKYKQMCKDRGLTPKFNQFATEDNYWKLLIDRKMINQQTGKLIRQKAVTPTFDFDVIKGVVDKFVKNYDAGLEARALNHVVENWDSIPQRIKDLKKQGGTKAKKTKKAVNTLANQTVAAQPKDGVKNSDRYKEIAKGFTDHMVNIVNTKHGWYAKDVFKYVEEHPELGFIELIYAKDKDVKKLLEKFLNGVDDVKVLEKLSWYMGEAYGDKDRTWNPYDGATYPYRGAVRTFRNAIKKRINAIMTEKVGGTNLGIKNGEVTLEDIKGLYEKLNSNEEMKEFAEKVFATSEKLGVNIRFVNQTLSKQRVAGDNLGDMVEYKTSYFNDTAVTDQRKANTILHELIHACTVYVMEANKTMGDVSWNKSENYNKISNAATRLNRIYSQIAYDPDFRGQYGITNAKEMVAELANENFVGLMKKKNLWDQIVDWICDLFGIRRGTSAYDNARLCLDYILDNPEVSEYKAFAAQQRSNARYNGMDVFGQTRYSERVLMGSLFSGGGTLEAGLAYQMLDKQFGVEYDGKIASVYADNHGDHIQVGRVEDFNISKYDDIFYLHASPVCHNFSKAKHGAKELQMDIDSAKATAKHLETAMPQVFTVENAPAYRKSESLKIITDKLSELGYKWDVDVYNSADYGSATSRNRVILRAVKDGELPAKPTKQARTNSWDKVTRDLWRTLPKAELRPSFISAIKNTPNLPILDANGKVNVNKPLLILTTTSGHQVTFCWEGEVCPTLTTKCGEARLVMPDGNIYAVTPEFMGRIQGLPNDYKYPKEKTRAFTIIGNGIPTHLTKAVVGGVLDSAYEQTHEGKVLYSERVSNKELAKADDTALYIKNTANADYIGMIFNGAKTEETRSRRTLDAFIGKDFYVTDGKYVYGSIVLGEPHQYTEAEFHEKKNQLKHRVPVGDEYDIKPGGTKWAYPIESYKKFDKPQKLSDSKEYKNSFQARQVKFAESATSNRDRDYLAAVKNGDMETAQRMVDEAAKAAGYSVKVYHGTNQMGFTVFDPKKSDDKISLFFTDSQTVAKTYASHHAKVKPTSSFPEIKSFKYEKGKKYSEEEMREAFDLIQSVSYIYGIPKFNVENQTMYHAGTRYSAKQLMELADYYSRMGLYEVFVNPDGMMEVDAENHNWNSIADPNVVEYRYKINYKGENFNYFKAEADDAFTLSLYKDGEVEYNGDITFHEMMSMLRKRLGVSRAEMAVRHATDGSGMGSLYHDHAYSDANGNYAKKFLTTRELAKRAKKEGYKGLIIKNVYDNGGKATGSGWKKYDVPSTLYILFESNQVKSADPVTYDDSGNVIPLSERFNEENDDIRYSERTAKIDTEGMSAEAKKIISNLELRTRFSRFSKGEYASYSTERIERELNRSSASEMDYAKSYIAWVKPIDFLYATTTSREGRMRIEDEAGGLDLDRLRDETQPIHLTVDFETGKIVGHEGRHRMTALNKAGVEKVAVIFDAWNDDRYNTKPVDMMRIGGQEFDRYHGGLDFYVHDMLPLSKRYADAAKKLFSEVDGSIKFSERGEGTSNRHLLANAFEGITNGSEEYKLIQRYKGYIAELNSLEAKLSDFNQQIRKIRFGKGEYDAEKLARLEDEARKIAEAINKYDQYLLSLEASEPLRKVIERERLKEREMSSKKLREVKERYRLQKEVKESELLRDIRETRAALKNQKNETSIMEKEFIRIAKAYEKLDANSTAKSNKDTKAIADLKTALKEESKKHRDDQKTWEAEFNRLMREYELADRSIDRLEEKIERQKQAAKNKVESRQKTELRHKIRKTVRDLDKLLNRGNKKLNVKEDMKGFVSKALELADYIFTDHISNDELIRMGITVRMTPKEAALVKETEDILSQLYDNADSLTDEEFTRLDAKRKANEDKLRDLLKAQRNERLNTPVYNLFNDLVTEYASLKNSKQDSVKAAYDEVLENSLRAFMGDEDRVKILKNMRVADMTTEELNWLYRAYTMVLTNVRNANKFHVKGMTATIEQMVGRIAGDFSSRKIPDKKLAIAVQKLANKIGWDYEKLYYALDRIGSEAFSELIVNIADSENTVMQDVMEAIAYRDEIVKNYGFNNWAVNKEIDREFMDNSGKKFKMTLGQLMSLYAYSRREGAWDHIEYGGFVFGDAALTNPRPADSYKLSKEQCEAITSLLTKEQKGYVEDMQKYLSETMGEKGNEVSMQLYGIKMFGEKNYFPIHVAGQFKAQAQESQAKAAAGFSSMSNAGFTHAQNPNAKAPFVLEGFNEIWTDHVNEMSRYHGTVPALEDLRRVMNRSAYSDSVAESQSIKQLMENSYGKEAVDYFDNLYREANSGAITDKLQKNSKKLLSLFRKNSVAYSLSVIIQQPSALVRAYAMIDKKYFGFKGFGAITSGVAKAVSSKWNPAYANAYNEILKYAPGVTMAKEIGGFDTATGGSIRSYLLDTGKSLKQKWNTGTALEKGKAVLDVVDDNAIANLPNVADKIAWIEIWNACKREAVVRNKNLKPGSEEFMQAVGKRFTEVIRATQVYDSIFAKSPMLKSKNLAVQYLVSFMNEPNTVANMVEKAVRDATKGDWKSGAKTAAVVVHSIIFTNVLKSLVYAMRDEDEDETYIEKYIEAVAGNMMSDFNALNYIPIARDVVSLAQGYDVERADMAIVADALDALNRVIENGFKETEDMTEEQLVEFDKKCTEANWKLVESVAAFFGIPVKNIRREIEGVINTAKNTAANNGQTTLLSAWEKVYDAVIESIPFMQVKNTKQDKLYEAIMAGDQAYLSRLKSTYKDDSAYQSAVRKALRENDSRIHDAAQAKYEGRTEEYKRIFREIQKEGKFSFDDIMSAVNSEESAIRNKLEPDKATSSYTASDFVESIVLGDSKSAEAMKEDIIATKVANGKTQAEAEKEFISSVATGIRDAYSSGLLDEAGAEKMLMEYADKDEEEAASKVGYWGFCEDNPKYDYFTESNVKDYREFAEPENISLEVYAQFINGTKGLADIKDKWGDVEVTKREQVLEVIDSLPLTWQQKDALYLAAGYSESKIWDVPW